jgi:plasmid maintenance system antidote protein VapI
MATALFYLQTIAETPLQLMAPLIGRELAEYGYLESRVSMRTESSFSPQWASAPGDTIKDMLDQRGLTISAFAQQLACTYDDALALLSGRMALTPFLAQQLSRAVGSSVDFWLTRESQFREDTARVQQMDAEWVRNIPIAEMIRFGWLAAEASLSLREATILSFFDMPSISAIRAEYRTLERAFAFKRSRSHETQPAPLAAWLRQGVVEAEKIKCTAWDPSGFRQALDKIRDLTRSKHPNQFIPVLQRSCATHGVAAVVVRTPNGCPASGATRFLSREKALIMLSFRYLTDDHFWFTFFHEAGHLLLHS